MTNSKFELRKGIRATAPDRQGREVFHPEAIEDHPELLFDHLIEQYGSVAHAALQAGIPYLNTTTNEQAIVGEADQDWRVNAISTAQSLAGAIDSAPDTQAIALHVARDSEEILDAFGSREAILREAGIDPVETADTVPIHERTATIRSAARELGGVPSPVYVAHRGDFCTLEVASWFDNWEAAIEASYATARDPTSLAEETLQQGGDANGREGVARIAATQVQNADSIGGYPYPDPKAELIASIETLAEQIDHRPSTREMAEYLPYDRANFADIFGDPRPIEAALQASSVPSERDLSPSGSMYRQPEVGEDDIPTHTDLLRDIHIVHVRGPNDVVTDFEDRGILEKHHFEVQFGSFEDAIAAHDQLDSSDYRESRSMDLAPILRDTIDELQTVLERVPTVSETIEITDYEISDFVDEFDSWGAVVDEHPPLDTWTNEVLLDDIEAVGQMMGRPPTPTDIVDASEFPFASYIRRFGSLPTVLSNVGVNVSTDIPEGYLAAEATRDVWEQTERLVETGFSIEPAVYDDFWRLFHEFGSAPSREQYERYGLYDPSLAASEEEWEQTLADVGFTDPRSNAGFDFDRRSFEAEVESLADSLTLPVFPRDVECFTNYSLPTVAVEYGTLEAAFDAVDIETRHLEQPIETPQDVWQERNEQTRNLIEGLRRLDENSHSEVTYGDVREDSDLSSNWIYYAFDSYSDAADVAGIDDGAVHTSKGSRVEAPREESSDSILNSMMTEVKDTDDTAVDEH